MIEWGVDMGMEGSELHTNLAPTSSIIDHQPMKIFGRARGESDGRWRRHDA